MLERGGHAMIVAELLAFDGQMLIPCIPHSLEILPNKRGRTPVLKPMQAAIAHC